MVWRVFRFFLFQLVGGLLGYALPVFRDPTLGALVGVLVASAAWVAWDLHRGGVLLAWLRDGDLSRPPRVGGLWGDVAGRAYRQGRGRGDGGVESEARPQEFRGARRATPERWGGAGWCQCSSQ